MDRYLFRGLRADGKGWVYGFLISRPDGSAYIEGYNGNIFKHYAYEVIPETVGQWTGLRDKWEQMIFEADIIVSEIEEVSGVIIYLEENARYCLEMPEENGLYGLDERYTYEVIGNIYEEKKQ